MGRYEYYGIAINLVFVAVKSSKFGPVVYRSDTCVSAAGGRDLSQRHSLLMLCPFEVSVMTLRLIDFLLLFCTLSEFFWNLAARECLKFIHNYVTDICNTKMMFRNILVTVKTKEMRVSVHSHLFIYKECLT